MANDPQVPWTDEQWARVNQVIQEEAKRARVAATFLPLYGPLDADADFVRRQEILYAASAGMRTVAAAEVNTALARIQQRYGGRKLCGRFDGAGALRQRPGHPWTGSAWASMTGTRCASRRCRCSCPSAMRRWPIRRWRACWRCSAAPPMCIARLEDAIVFRGLAQSPTVGAVRSPGGGHGSAGHLANHGRAEARGPLVGHLPSRVVSSIHSGPER